MEYWAVVWGTVLMTITGYVLWNPVLITQYLPGEVVPAAKIAHGLEALLAVLSSFRNRVLPKDLIVFGELGLTGEVRPVASGQQRLAEARKHGFRQAIVPFANRPKDVIAGMTNQHAAAGVAVGQQIPEVAVAAGANLLALRRCSGRP